MADRIVKRRRRFVSTTLHTAVLLQKVIDVVAQHASRLDKLERVAKRQEQEARR